MERTVQNNVNKERIYSFDFIRALCAIGIILYHFSCELLTVTNSSNLFYPCHTYSNGDWGNTIVNIFFILSGAALYYNYREVKSLKVFYYKRFKSIFPMYYIAFIIFYIWSCYSTRNPFYGGNPVKLLLSVAGLDGYFQYRMVNYYQVGEWFLGAIIILYALYPLIIKYFNKSIWITFAISMVLYSTVFIPGLYVISQSLNLFSALISFVIGMIIMHYKDCLYNNKVLFIISLLMSLVIIFFDFSYIPDNVYHHVLAITLFISLSFIGGFLMRVNVIKKIFVKLSSISFAIFLLQHKIIYKVFQYYVPTNAINELVTLIITVIITICFAMVLYAVNKLILRSKPYKSFEKHINN